MNHMSSIIIGVVIAYTIVTVFLGLFAKKGSVDTAEDFFLARRSLSWPHLTLTYIATWVSTMGFLAVPGFFFSKGVNWLIIMETFFFCGLFLMWFVGRKLWALSRENGYITPAELLADFYKSPVVGYITAFVCIIGLIPYCLIQTIAIGKVVSAATNDAITYEAAVVLASVIGAFYMCIGGIRAIVLTDIIQAVLFCLIILFGAGVVLYLSDGFLDGMRQSFAAKPHIFSINTDQWGKTLTLMVTWSLGFVVLPHMWQRNYMAKSAEVFTKALIAQAVFYIFMIFLLMTIGMLSAGFIFDLSDSDKLVPTLYATYLPWALPILVLATFAAGMSTLDSQLLTASSIFVRDILHPMTKLRLEEKRGKQWGRYIVLILIILITVLSLLPEAQGPIITLASKGVGLVSLLIIPLIGPLFWKKATATGAIAAMLVGIAIQAVFELNIISYKLPNGLGSPIPALIIGFIVFFVLSKVSQEKRVI